MMRAAAWGGKDREEDAVRHAQRGSAEGASTRLYANRLKRVESTLHALLASVASSVDTEPPAADRPRSFKSRPSIGAAIAEVARRQKELDEEGCGAVPADDLQRQLSGLSAKLDEMRREQAARQVEPPYQPYKLQTETSDVSDALQGVAQHCSVAALEEAIRTLSQKTEALRSESIRDAVAEPLEELVGEFKRSLAAIDPRPTIAGVEAELKQLGAKLENHSRPDVDSAAFGRIQQQTREICNLWTTAVTRPLPTARIEQQIERLAESIERQRAEGGATGGTAGIEERLDALAAKIEEALTETCDESRYEALARRIDDVHRDLAELIAERPGMDTRLFENLVGELAEKIEQTKVQPDPRALNALERQIAGFAQRLETATSGLSSLASLEQTINARFAELEQGRRAALEAAQNAGDRSVEATNIGHELQRLRAMQDEADQRTASTLNAVHETLEKVVNRLATMEDDVTPCPKVSNEMLASGPAPIFAPAPQRTPRQSDLADLRDLRISPEQLATRHDDGKKAPPPPAALEDLLIEPGSGFPVRHEEDSPRAREAREQECPATRADFIAAARRAAQAAQTEAATSAEQNPARAIASKDRAGLVRQARNFIEQHKRPMVLSLAILFVAIGTYAVVKSVGRAAPTGVSSSADTPAVAMTVPPQITPPAAPAVKTAALPLPAALTPPVAPGVDTMPTASIPQPKAVAPDITQSDPQAAAAAGDAKAQFLLATNYAEGRNLPRNLSAAAAWYTKAAAQGLAPAQYRLGGFYEKGLGVMHDLDRAKNLYQRAAEQGNVRAMHNLAVLAADGGNAGKPDYATAAQWFKKAAEYGVRDSQYNFAVLLARGLGVQQNFVAAYMWFSIVAAQGDDDAARKRDDVGARLNANELAAAKALADAFRAKTPDPSANDVEVPNGGWISSVPSSGTTNKTQHPKTTLM